MVQLMVQPTFSKCDVCRRESVAAVRVLGRLAQSYACSAAHMRLIVAEPPRVDGRIRCSCGELPVMVVHGRHRGVARAGGGDYCCSFECATRCTWCGDKSEKPIVVWDHMYHMRRFFCSDACERAATVVDFAQETST